MDQIVFTYPDFNPETLYTLPDGLYWTQVELADGRTVPMLLPEKYKEISKCNKHSKCTNWSCVQCYESSFMSSDLSKVRCWLSSDSPRLVAASTHKHYTFWCNVCLHQFSKPLNSARKTGCSYCDGQKLCKHEQCKHCFDKSFASHPNAQFWSQANNLDPRYISKHSHGKYLFTCPVCNHDFTSQLNSINKGQFCSYCRGQALCDSDTCTFCFDKSFASHPKSQWWSPENNILPRFVRKSSSAKYRFDCECGHSFKSTLGNVNAGKWCSYCCYPPLKLCHDDCIQCYERSFASHPKSKYWSKLNACSPRDVFKHANSKYYFDCDVCHTTFSSTLNNIVYGNWCPKCKASKLEKSVSEFLDLNQIAYQTQYALPDSKYKYDFYLPDRDLLIECDGEQHFKLVPHFHRASKGETEQQHFKRRQRDDREKDRLARLHGKYLVRIDYTLKGTLQHYLGYILECPVDGAGEEDVLAKVEYKDLIFYSDRVLYSYLISS